MVFVKGKSGNPKGRSKGIKAIEQKVVFDHIKRRVLKNAQKLISAQMNIALGTSYLMKITTHKKSKEVEIIKDPEIIASYFDDTLDYKKEDNEFYYITTEKPDNKALDSLFNRVLGKPQESLDVTSGGESLNKMNYERAKDIIGRGKGSDKSDRAE